MVEVEAGRSAHFVVLFEVHYADRAFADHLVEGVVPFGVVAVLVGHVENSDGVIFLHWDLGAASARLDAQYGEDCHKCDAAD